jgi:glycosyltransferase involved in cell wall biosynthesis
MAGICAQRLDVMVANSKKVAEVMSGYWPDKPMRVIPFLTSDQPMRPPTRSGVCETGDLRVAYLGRLVSHKRPDELVRRWSSIIRHPGLEKARLDVYGYDPDGAMLAELRAFVAQSGLEKQVAVRGEYQLSDVPAILARTDLVALPSRDEGLPLVLVEAMSHGVPFVATDAGGTGELGFDNPDVLVTGKVWEDFEAGLLKMAGRIRDGAIDSRRLHQWSEDRYGFQRVSQQWIDCLLDPKAFFSLRDFHA